MAQDKRRRRRTKQDGTAQKKCHKTLYSGTGKYNTTQTERKRVRQDKTTKRSVNWQRKKDNGIRKNIKAQGKKKHGTGRSEMI